jgi:hypothetical protein
VAARAPPESSELQQQQQAGGTLQAVEVPPPLLPNDCQLELLSHLFVQCPSVTSAWQWLEGAWDTVQPGAGLDCSNARVVLLDDGGVWQPPAELHHLWTHLRLLMLESIWTTRCERSGQPYSSAEVVGRFLAVLQQQMQHDWARTLTGIHLDSGVPLSWLRGRSPVLSGQRFTAKWKEPGVLYMVEDALLQQAAAEKKYGRGRQGLAGVLTAPCCPVREGRTAAAGCATSSIGSEGVA